MTHTITIIQLSKIVDLRICDKFIVSKADLNFQVNECYSKPTKDSRHELWVCCLQKPELFEVSEELCSSAD